MRNCILLIFLFVYTSVARAGDVEMKQVTYRGGIITFTIPEHWLEQYEPDGGGIFYEDTPNTGTLRLNVITLESPKPILADDAFLNLSKLKNVEVGTIQRLENGNALATSVQHANEEGQAITLYWWYIANLTPPNHMQLANFSYTVLTAQENDPQVIKEIRTLTEAVKNAKFHSANSQ